MSWLAAEPQGCLGLGLAQWWAEPSFGMCGCGSRPLESRVSFLVEGAKAQKVGVLFWGSLVGRAGYWYP